MVLSADYRSLFRIILIIVPVRSAQKNSASLPVQMDLYFYYNC